MPVILKVVVPTLVRVIVFGRLVARRPTEPKLRLVGESFAAVPIPVRPTFSGLPAALSVTLRAAVRVPLAVGLNFTLMVQLPPAGNELPQVWVCAKSDALVPAIAMAVMVMLVVPVFLSVTVWAALVVPIG